MNNEFQKQELNSTVEDYKQEVKQGFFSKLFNSFSRKALPPAKENFMEVTNISINTMLRYRRFKSRLIKFFNSLRKISTANREFSVENSLSPQVISKDTIKNYTSKNKLSSYINSKENIIIPKRKIIKFNNIIITQKNNDK